MSRILVIPDVHLKPEIYRKAAVVMYYEKCDATVMLGDLADDWNQDRNIELYDETFDAALEYIRHHQDTFLCLGNHDVSYRWGFMQSGYSYYARDSVLKGLDKLEKALPPENVGYVFRFGKVLFSHAGLTESFVHRNFGQKNIDYVIAMINGKMEPEQLWEDDSPLWARPQLQYTRLYPEDMYQVVGHTPQRAPMAVGKLISTDTFSTYRNGMPYGNKTFIIIDTADAAIEYVKG
ncbi:MAG: metallophosphoesterase [Lachnospiraceae bacterium]|nr:metallophosphoesterase [Lachnospiraceae bacterium]